MQAQVTLTVPVAKRIIAEAIYQMPEVQQAITNGKIILKGGTTVSAVSERMGHGTLRLSGRISANGAKASTVTEGNPHSAFLVDGKISNIDADLLPAVHEMTRTDVAIIGANALDIHGQAALVLGLQFGGAAGKAISGILAQGCKVIIACGLEKLIPTSIQEAVQASGIRKMDWSMGMSIGLTPLYGEVITEKVALEKLAKIKATVIASGGIAGAEGSTTLVLEGEESEVKKAVQIVLDYHQAENSDKHSMAENSVLECSPGAYGCKLHHICGYRDNNGELKIS